MEQVTAEFAEQGCFLLATEYVNTTTKMEFRCSCGGIGAKSLVTFRNNPMCEKCARKRSVDKQRHSYEFIRGVFESRGCIPLFSEYHRAKEKLPYICKCGNHTFTTYDSFKDHYGCRNCAALNLREQRQFDIEDVRKYVESRACKLLSSEYVNARTPLSIECERGHKFETTLDGYKHVIHNCPECYLEFNRGPNHHSWNPNRTEEERIVGRNFSEYDKWRISVYERDRYTCQACGSTKRRLNAHHILNYATHPEGRVDIDNGITLCKPCHKEFHKRFGNRKNSRLQMATFLADKFREQKRLLEQKERMGVS